MKNILFCITLLSSFCGPLKSAEQQYQFDDTDKVLFQVYDDKTNPDDDGYIEALYPTKLIKSVSDATQSTVDKNSLFDICESAIAQTVHHKERELGIIIQPPKGVTGPFNISLKPLDIGPKRINRANKRAYNVYQSFSTLTDTITLKDKDLLLLLQFSVKGLKCNGADLEIKLHPNLKPLQKTFIATQLLTQFMEKYRAHENKDIYDQSQK